SDSRVVAATKEDSGSPAIRAKFREDSFYRSNVVTIRIPPSRERREDIPSSSAHYSGHASRRFQRDIPDMPADIKRHSSTHDWPGNVRELENSIERVTAYAGSSRGAQAVEARQASPFSEVVVPELFARHAGRREAPGLLPVDETP
ncbi:hypothetical protein OY671_012840, partial [Metschnikowia pulcherrima]